MRGAGRGGGVDFFENPGGGGAEGPGGCLRRIGEFGGGGVNIFCSAPKCPPSQGKLRKAYAEKCLIEDWSYSLLKTFGARPQKSVSDVACVGPWKIGRTPKGAYSSRGRSRHLLETPFSEHLLRTFSEPFLL